MWQPTLGRGQQTGTLQNIWGILRLIPRKFCWPRLKIFYFCMYLAWPKSNRPKHTTDSGSVHDSALSDSETIFYQWLDLADVFWKLCHMPNMSTLLAGAVLSLRQVLQPMPRFVPKLPACSPVTAAQTHLRGAAGRMLSSPVWSTYFTRQMD